MYNMDGVGTLMILGMIFFVLIVWLGPILGLFGLGWLLAPHIGYTITSTIFWIIFGVWSLIILILGYITFKR